MMASRFFKFGSGLGYSSGGYPTGVHSEGLVVEMGACMNTENTILPPNIKHPFPPP